MAAAACRRRARSDRARISGLGAEARRSVPLARVELAQPRERVEVLEKGFGDGGEVRPPADAVEVGHDLVAGPTHEVGLHPVELQVLEMPQELFAVEVGKGTAHLGVYCEFLGAHGTSSERGNELKDRSKAFTGPSIRALSCDSPRGLPVAHVLRVGK